MAYSWRRVSHVFFTSNTSFHNLSSSMCTFSLFILFLPYCSLFRFHLLLDLVQLTCLFLLFLLFSLFFLFFCRVLTYLSSTTLFLFFRYTLSLFCHLCRFSFFCSSPLLSSSLITFSFACSVIITSDVSFCSLGCCLHLLMSCFISSQCVLCWFVSCLTILSVFVCARCLIFFVVVFFFHFPLFPPIFVLCLSYSSFLLFPLPSSLSFVLCTPSIFFFLSVLFHSLGLRYSCSSFLLCSFHSHLLLSSLFCFFFVLLLLFLSLSSLGPACLCFPP